jgi:hypothetical protein
MAQLQKSAVTLRIMGENLIPDEITTLLRASPTHTETKGDKIVGKKTGHVRIAKVGMWRLRAADREPEDMDAQIHEILSQMTPDLTVWQTITKKYHADLFCGLFMRMGNEGLTISPQSLAALGARGIEMGFDIYAGDGDADDAST